MGAGTKSPPSNSVTPLTVPGAPTITPPPAATSRSSSAGRRRAPMAAPRSPATWSPRTSMARPRRPRPSTPRPLTDGDRVDQRHRLHLHRCRHQHPGTGPSLGHLEFGHPGHPGRCTHHRDGHPGNASACLTWTARASTGGAATTATWSPPTSAARPRRPRPSTRAATTETVISLTNGTPIPSRWPPSTASAPAPIGGLQLGDPGHRAQGAHHRDGHRRQHLGHRELDGAGLQRGQPHHRLRGHPVHRRHGPGGPDLQFARPSPRR